MLTIINKYVETNRLGKKTHMKEKSQKEVDGILLPEEITKEWIER